MTKKLLFILTITFYMSLSYINAQGLYIDIQTGYNVGMNSYIPNFYNSSDASVTNSSSSNIKTIAPVTLGSGFNFAGNIGYMITKNMGTELGFSYQIGSKSKADNTFYDGSNFFHQTTSIYANNCQIIPTLIFTLGLEKLNPYVKVGLLMNIGTITINSTDGYHSQEMKLTNGFDVGLLTTVGIVRKVTDKISVFGELRIINSNCTPLKGTIVSDTYYGNDNLPYLTTNDKEIIYGNTSEATQSSEPSQQLKTSYSINSVGINLGLKIKI